ncbi:MAG: alpha/beta hydrolase [Chitinophagales bacterium]|nr:alpha/beta hydrolase [Chitinophagales bacterium]MDW8418476.1 alpha/beta hydrolase [Chitinophagales bacterium]
MRKLFLYPVGALVTLATAVIIIGFFRPSLIHNKNYVKEKFTTPHSHYLKWRDAEIHYIDEGEGTPLLLIHGFGGNHRNFNKITEKLKTRYRVIRVDLPGFGLSDCPAVNEEKPEFAQLYKDFFRFFLDTLRLDTFYVAGNSMGGMMAWHLAAEHPARVKKLVLLASAGYDLEKTAKGLFIIRFRWLSRWMEKGLPEWASWGGARRCYADDTKIDAREVEYLNILTNREGNIRHMLRMAGDTNYPDTTLIKRISCPTLIIWGKQDAIVPAEHAYRFARDIPHAQLSLLDNCGHVPMIECTDTTSALMLDFLK